MKLSNARVRVVGSCVPRRCSRMVGIMTTLIAMMALVLSAGVLPANASSITDHTCQPRAEHISTCEWLVVTLVHKYGITDNQIIMDAGMQGGAANREIVSMVLYGRPCTYSVCGWTVVMESRVPVTSGKGTIFGTIGPRLCNYYDYLPVFTYRIYEGKSKGWVTGKSTGHQKIGISPCNSE